MATNSNDPKNNKKKSQEEIDETTQIIGMPDQGGKSAAEEDETTQILGMPEPKEEPVKPKIEPTPAPINTAEEFDPVPKTPESSGKSSMKWMIWVCVIAIVALIIWWCLPKATTTVDDEEVIQTESATTMAPEEAVSDSTPAVANESKETAETPEANTAKEKVTESAVPAQSAATPAQPAAASEAAPAAPKKAFKPKNSLDRQALEVISGKKGNNPVRKKNLGKKYRKVQRRVNELKREGVF